MKKGSGFDKFFKNKEKTGAAKKEAIRKEKRDLRKERENKIADAKRQKRAAGRTENGPPKYNLEPPKSRFQKTDSGQKGKPGFKVDKKGSNNNRFSNDRPRTEGRSSDQRRDDRPERKPAPFAARDGKPRFEKPARPEGEKRFGGKPSFQKASPKRFDDKSSKPERPTFKPRTSEARPSNNSSTFKSFDRKPAFNKDKEGKPSFAKSRTGKPASDKPWADKRTLKPRPANAQQSGPKEKGVSIQKAAPKSAPTDLMPLNKYIAHSGICSRRDAVDLIKAGKVKVNGELIVEPGHKVQLSDEVRVAGRHLAPVKDFIYVLLNKPKDYITTTDDPQERRTVLDLLKGVPEEVRIYPVGRLDRNTSGVLLLTNDGDLSQKLTHPSNEIKKVYAVTLDKPLTRAHFDDIIRGVQLEDGPAQVDTLAYTDTKDLTQIGVELHTGRNRIVRRIFEHFGYDVKGLDRVVFAGLTKKNVNRGKWRYLNEREVRDLKFFKKGR